MTGKAPAVLALFAALSGCGSLGIQDDPSSRIEAALTAYSASLLANDADRIAAAYTPDGEMRVPGREPIRGPDAIRAFLRDSARGTVEENEMRGLRLQIVGPGALQTGTFRLKTRRADGALAESAGTFEAEWERQADGSWLLARMTTDPPPLEIPLPGEPP